MEILVMDLSQSTMGPDTKSVFVFGSGTFATKIVSSLQVQQIEVLVVRDKPDIAGKIVGGFTVKSLKLTRGSDIPVLIAVHNSFASISEIEDSLRSQGFDATYTPPQIASFLAQLGKEIENYWLTSSPDCPLSRSQHSELASMLSDQQSLDLLHNQLDYRRTGQSKFLGTPMPLEQQYFPADVPGFFSELADMSAFVDLGAYQGDTLEALEQSKLRPKVYVGLEPEIENFKLLESKAASFFGQKLIFPFAAHSSIETLKLSSAGPSSSILEKGGVQVQAAPLDVLAWGLRVSYIKMDIEGSESEALLGAKELIARDKPVLAISVYHKPDDLIKLPQIINSFGVYGSFFLRSYGDQTFDTVLYCLPS
jgi:FkbM family methyltransferase